MKTIKLEINGATIEARPGQTVLEVVQEQNLDSIPTLCHSPELKPYGSCFLCVVELEGKPNLVPSCATPVAPGMKVTTRNDRINKSRRTALELLLSNHYADCVSPCMEGCPAGVDVQGYLVLADMGEFKRAADLIRETNPLPGICGRVCVRRCEVVCRRQDVDESIAINDVKRYITDSPGVYDDDPVREPSKGISVGIVGSGPAGLTAAWFLGKKGYDPVIYESLPETGGMLRYGIPEYRLPGVEIDREVDYIRRAGAEIHCNMEVGKDITLDEMMDQHAAVFLAPGAMQGKGMMVDGENDTEGVVKGVDYLLEKADNPTPTPGTALVIGGGNTAVDVARTAWRVNAEKVIMLYRRTRAEMPADPIEVEDLLEEGVQLMELVAPVGLVKRDDGKIKALTCVRMVLGEPDASGRRRPVPQKGSEFDIPCDWVFPSIGQMPFLTRILKGSRYEPSVSRWSTFEIDKETMQTSIPGIFSGGDSADDGPTVVIDAIRDGQKAAKGIDAFISGKSVPKGPFLVRKEFWDKPGKKELGEIPESPRRQVHSISVQERIGNFNEVSLGFEHDDMTHESERCLSCGCMAFDWCDLRLYSEEYGADLGHYKGYVRKHKVDDSHPYVVYDPNKCILCSRCIRTCERILPIAALGLVGRGFKTEMRPSMNDPLVDTTCIACGNCIDSCPTGALTPQYPYKGRANLATTDEQTHCALCSIACPITVNKVSDSKFYIGPSGVPGEYLCHEGRYGSELYLKSKRLTAPQQREGMTYQELSFEKATAAAVAGLKDVVQKHGPESVGVFYYPDCSTEEMYLASRLAREGLGTNNIGSLAMMETGLVAGTLDESLGFTASTADRTALRDADLILCNNIDPEQDFLILGVEIQDAIKAGARLVMASSAESTLVEMAEIYLDPMRGRASTLWNGVIQALINEGAVSREAVQAMPGGAEFLADPQAWDPATAAAKCGVSQDKILATAGLIAAARKTVIVHSLDRSRDFSPGDAQVLANLALILRQGGNTAEMILPSLASNGAGVEIAGADPMFGPGRTAVSGFAGANNRGELLAMLQSGKIRGALVIGEDPLSDDRTASYFGGVEHLVTIDWARTETVMFANIALPGSTPLESDGTRCNFEGSVIRYDAALQPPAGFATWQVLTALADLLGVDVPHSFADLASAVDTAARSGVGELAPFLWNTGQDHQWSGSGRLVVSDVTVMPSPRTPALSVSAHYRREFHEVGIKNFRVGERTKV